MFASRSQHRLPPPQSNAAIELEPRVADHPTTSHNSGSEAVDAFYSVTLLYLSEMLNRSLSESLTILLFYFLVTTCFISL